MSFPEITNFRPAFYNQKFRRAAVTSLCMKCALQDEVHSQKRSYASSARNDFVFPSYCVNSMSVCLTFESISGHLLKERERYRNTHSTESGETETDKTRKLSTRKEVLASRKLGCLRSQNRYPEEYEAHVHILLTNNSVQVYEASLGWAEGDKPVCSARMIYVPSLFRLKSLKYETPLGYEGYKGIKMDVRNIVTN